MYKVCLTVFFVIIICTLTGCFDAVEIDENLHVLIFGVDRGISDKWRLTIQFLDIKMAPPGSEGGQPQDDGGKPRNDTITIDAPSFFTGIDMLNAHRPRTIDFAHAQIIIFSEELARSGLVGEYIAPIIRFKEIRRSARVLVAKGEVYKLLKESQPLIGASVSEDFQLLIQQSENIGLFPSVTLECFYHAMKSPYGQPIATLAAVNDFQSFLEEGEPWGTTYQTGGNYYAGQLPRIGDGKIELFGTALFQGDLMVGELTGDETRYLLMARGEFERTFFTIPDPHRPDLIIPLDLRRAAAPEIQINLADPQPVIRLKVYLDAEILAVQSSVAYAQPDQKNLLEKQVTEIVKQGLEDVIQKCQALGVDVFRFGERSTKYFLTIPELEEYKWNKRFCEAEIMVDVQLLIPRTGRILTL